MFSHHWEAPSFKDDYARFTREVFDTIWDGDPNDQAKMPGAFSPARGSGTLSVDSNVQIFISTPKNPEDGREHSEARADIIVDTLAGEGKPWAGIMPIRRGYLKPGADGKKSTLRYGPTAKSLLNTIIITKAEFSEEKANQQVIYRVWLKHQKFEHQWDAKVDIQKDAACLNF